MPLLAGSRLGPYEILAPIGAGGMGEVYKANDPRLGRDIAIKVLPEAIASDSVRLLGRWEEALARARTPARSPTHPTDVDVSDQASTMAVLVAHAGDTAAADREIAIARRKQGRSHFHHASYNHATAFALLKRNKEAIAWLTETAESGMPCYPLFEKDPFLDNLRGDPDFQTFLTRQRAQWERFAKTL
jgi:serine/threonine protein kinase